MAINCMASPATKHGLLPDALDHAFSETGARALFATPTLQTPTGTVMPNERRQEIANIIRKHNGFLLEDDAYAFLFTSPPKPISSMVPERSFYVTSFAKCLAPGSAHCCNDCTGSIPRSL